MRIIELRIVTVVVVVVVVVASKYFNFAGNTTIEDSSKDTVVDKWLTEAETIVKTIAKHYQLLDIMR